MSKSDKESKIVRPCPRCGLDVDFSQNKYRPFCSKRCKMADLGSWLKEEYYISSSLLDLEMDTEFKQR
ncbi:MAG: DNA gyrase inhibitor YacG [Thermodesulfobacteria bacterium]|nr:DNA gyrase inhibitor YacG [Thermodesulfobacteriota bacterium]